MINPEKERWLPIPGYDGAYEASSLGRIKSLQRLVGGNDGRMRMWPGKILSPSTHSSGYESVMLRLSGKGVRRFVHRLILETFAGPAPAGAHGCHWDGNRKNNNIENLRWATPAENAHDKKRHGTYICGNNCHASKLKEIDVLRIKRLLQRGKSQKSVGFMFGVSQGTVSDIVCGKTWRHVK